MKFQPSVAKISHCSQVTRPITRKDIYRPTYYHDLCGIGVQQPDANAYPFFEQGGHKITVDERGAVYNTYPM